MTISEIPHERFNGIITQKRQQTSDVCFFVVNNEFIKMSFDTLDVNFDLLTLGVHIEGMGIRNGHDVIEVTNFLINE